MADQLFKKKKPQDQNPEPKPKPENKTVQGKFKTFAYVLAWINFLAVIGLAIYEAIKEHQPPEKDEYYK